MHILRNNFGVRERNGMVEWKDDFGNTQFIVMLDANEKKQLIKSIKSLQYFDYRNSLLRNNKKLDQSSQAAMTRYRVEREFVRRFDPIAGYLEQRTQADKDAIIMRAYKAVFNNSAYDMDAFGKFKEMFLQLVEVYERTVSAKK